MTDEGTGPEQPTQPEEQEQPLEAAKEALRDVADFSTGEGMVAFAGIGILLIWLIFDVILDDYGQGFVNLIAAALVVIVPRLNPESVAKLAPVGVIMKVLGYGFGLFLIFEIFFIFDSGFYDEAMTIIGALLTYAVWAIGFLGARSIKI